MSNRRVGRFGAALLLVAGWLSASGVVVAAGAPRSTSGYAPDDRTSGWVARENARPGTTAWRITGHDDVGAIEGFVRSTSVGPGSSLPLFVSTAAPTFQADVFRMGWYDGAGGRSMWSSGPIQGTKQPPAVFNTKTGMATAPWTESLVLSIGADWPTGDYLVKLTSSTGDQSYVPFTVRDDSASRRLLVVNSVATWQAYNTWGGCSLYSCAKDKHKSRAVKVSFDRPYLRTWNNGSADFFDHEYPLVALLEEQGYDAAYITDVDLDVDPSLSRTAHSVLTLGHAEYYSSAMRSALVGARDAGINLAFFGSNAVYRHIRFESAGDGTPRRVVVNYRSFHGDPINRVDPSQATIEWRDQGKPESELVGIQYTCPGVRADLVVDDPSEWIWRGTGVTAGTRLHELVWGEADHLAASSPRPIDVLATSPVMCGRSPDTGNTTYYSAPSGAGVFASGTLAWICSLDLACLKRATFDDMRVVGVVRRATMNILQSFADGPAGLVHRSTGRAS